MKLKHREGKMNYIVKSRWEFLMFCIFAFFAFQYIEDSNIQKWLYIALAVIFLIFSVVILGNIEKIELTTNDKNKKFVILFSFLWCLLMFDIIVMLFGPSPEIGLIVYQISFFGLCFLVIAPIVKIPSLDEGIITSNNKPIRDEQISLISLYKVNSLQREFEEDYVLKEIFGNRRIGVTTFKVMVNFSSTFFKRIKKDEEKIDINRINNVIGLRTDKIVTEKSFGKSLEIGNDIDGKIIVT